MASMPMSLRNRLPKELSGDIDTWIGIDKDARDAVSALQQRQQETKMFSSDDAAYIAGLAMVPTMRSRLDNLIDRRVRLDSEKYLKTAIKKGTAEVIIGGGLHAAIYCAVRREMGHPRPLVIEQSERIGGVFAMTKGPAFYLNSRNRPGQLGLPGDRRSALNVLPGAPVQPSDLSNAEYQRNNDLALAIRMTLLMHGRCVVGRQVGDVGRSAPTTKGSTVYLDDGQAIPCARIIDARGLGTAKSPKEGAMNFMEFMARFDQAFPLKGMRRVAVLGAGDSGKTAIEALVGQGPASGWSTAAMDWVDRIDWYDSKLENQLTSDGWTTCNRSRYRGLARFMPKIIGEDARIMPIAAAGTVEAGYKCAYVSGRKYDAVIACTGWSQPPNLFPRNDYAVFGDRATAIRADRTNNALIIGANARIGFSSGELLQELNAIPENQTALFRLADRTAMTAASV